MSRDDTAERALHSDAPAHHEDATLRLAIFDRSRDAMLVADDERRYVDVNRAACELFDTPRENFVERRIEDFYGGGTAAEVEEQWRHFLEVGSLDGEFPLRRPDGTVRTLEFRAIANVVPGRHLSILRDVTEMVRLQRDAAERARAEDASRVRYQEKLRRIALETSVTEEQVRRRIALDLHERLGQSLALAQLKLGVVRASAVHDDVRTGIDEAVALLAQAITEARGLTWELSPPILYDLGLKEALSWLSEDIEQHHGVRVELHDDGLEKPLDETIAALVLRAVRELLMNVVKHANVPTAEVSLRRVGDHCEIIVHDAGVGFDPSAAIRGVTGGFGLLSVQEQIIGLGGTLTVVSASNRGTSVAVRIPLRRGVHSKG